MVRLPVMKSILLRMGRLRPVILATGVLTFAAQAAPPIIWERTEGESLAYKKGDEILWQFNFGTNTQKPYFHPLRVAGGESLTASRPTDHRWHYGLWFSWKYINGVNYWEEDKDGRAQGNTTWDAPVIKTRDDGAAEIQITLRYVSPTNGVMMIEQREIKISSPREKGEVTIDWTGEFEAMKELVLDRTPMPGEPHGAVNGGYAGLAFRGPSDPVPCAFITAEGSVEKFASDRARPNSKAAACNLTQGGRTNGVAIFSHVSNTGGDSPWYMINSKVMRWFSPSLLAPAPKKVKPHEKFTWKFRVTTQAEAWTPAKLREQSEKYNGK
jgi:hypothetical protein